MGRLQERLLWGLLVAVGLAVTVWAAWGWLGELRQFEPLLVSVTLDPAHDTPEVLRRYAAAHRARPGRWLFLTGERAAIRRLEQSCQVQSQEDPDAEPAQRITHTSRVMLIDAEGTVRGTYLIVEPIPDAAGNPTNRFRRNPEALERLREDARALAAGGRAADRLPRLGPVADFGLTDQDGRAVDKRMLRGGPWVVAFVFTRCGLSCPHITAAMSDLQDDRLGLLPTVNACLNAASAACLVLGYGFIRRRRVTAHVACMTAALALSALFLTSYLYYHFHKGSTPFTGEGWVRPVYFGILLSHTVLAAVIVPLILWTLWHALRDQYARHVRVARWTLPLWLYVSVTGVVVYLFLYHFYAV